MDDWGVTERPEFPARFLDLAGKSVFITGGGSGIGAALTEAFFEQGATVAFVQRSDATEFTDTIAKKARREASVHCLRYH